MNIQTFFIKYTFIMPYHVYKTKKEATKQNAPKCIVATVRKIRVLYILWEFLLFSNGFVKEQGSIADLK